jgi:hypothetical protein
MKSQPGIYPLDREGTIYAIRDELGNTIGTGTREVCEVLLHLLTNPKSDRRPTSNHTRRETVDRDNVRAAITI